MTGSSVFRSELIDDVGAMRAVYARLLSDAVWLDLRQLVTALRIVSITSPLKPMIAAVG